MALGLLAMQKRSNRTTPLPNNNKPLKEYMALGLLAMQKRSNRTTPLPNNNKPLKEYIKD
jgi:hypothetical protein